MKKYRKDKQIIILRNKMNCCFKETFCFLGRRKAKEFWKEERNNSGDFFIEKVSIKEAKETCREDYELEGLEAQLIYID